MDMATWKMGIQNQLPVIAMIFSQFIYAAMFLLSKAAVSSGMKSSVFVSYRQVIATFVLAPFAYFSQRKTAPPLTLYLLLKLWLVSTCGMAVTLNLHYTGLNYISATFATALTNTLPAIVFIVTLCFRIETLSIKKRQGWAKIMGTILSLTGAMVYTFYKGPPLFSGHHKEAHSSIAETHSTGDWIKGSLILIGSNLTWSFWLIMQTPILKEYPAKLRLTALQCGFSGLSSTIYAAARERHVSSWKLGWNVHLLAVAYCGIAVTGLSYSLQVWVVEKRGPVFTSIFSPLALILTAVFSAILFHETLHCGSVLGAVLLVVGLYTFLWGKNREAKYGSRTLDTTKEEAHLESIGVSSKASNDA